MKSSDDSFPTPEQKAVIYDNSRITVVRACPGSGKTRVLGESLKTRLNLWTKKNAGIAAISFTNVAHEQIAESIGGRIPYPHFIGTLDSFVLKYVVRPFGHLIGLPIEGARLIPSPLDEAIEYPEVEIDYNQKVSLFSIRFIDGSLQSPNMKAQTFRGQTYVSHNYTSSILKKKKEEWRKRGRITHSDCQYISSLILCHPEFGIRVSELVTRRFPMILVDEFQDTNWFLGHALIELLRSSFLEYGLVVGDPDQAIYEFGGAHPDLFNDIEKLPGSKSLQINQTHRCPKKIAAIATSLSDTGKQVIPREDLDQGLAIILEHDMERIEFSSKIRSYINKYCGENDRVAIVARREITLRNFLHERNFSSFKGVSHAGRNIDYAMQMFCSNQSSLASRIMNRELSWILFKNDSPSMSDLRCIDVDLFKWRRIIYQILKEATVYKDDETWNDWLVRVRKLVHDSAISLDCEFDKRSISDKLKKDPKGNVSRKKADSSDKSENLIERATIKTIHQVKGDEFECVVVLIPKPHPKYSPCPSVEWWPDAPSEERRVAFVGVSRASKTLILCIHRDTYNALKESRTGFVDLFEHICLFKKQHSLMDFS